MHDQENPSQEDSRSTDSAQPTPYRAAEPPDGGGCAETEGTLPTNRVPNNSIDDYFRPLRWGIDSLYFSYPGRLLPDVNERLARLKKLAQSEEGNEQALAQYPIGEHVFEVSDRAMRGYSYVLEDGALRVTLTRGKKMPQLVKVSAAYLAHIKIGDIGLIVDKVMAELIELSGSANVSRIDMFVDFESPQDMEWPRLAWVTRADAVWNFAEKEAFTGWMIGAGSPMVCRLYDKLRQAEKMGLCYLYPLWTAVGWNCETTIWRLEFQFRGEVLRQMGLHNLPQVLSNRNGLWSYATTEWLKLRIPSDTDKTRSRWPEHPLWGYLSSIDWETNGGPLTRKFTPTRVPRDERLAMSGLGLLGSLMAKQGITDIRSGALALADLVEREYAERAQFMGQRVEDFIQERVALKQRKFNTLLNDEAILDRIEAERLEEAADRYGRAKDGRL